MQYYILNQTLNWIYYIKVRFIYVSLLAIAMNSIQMGITGIPVQSDESSIAMTTDDSCQSNLLHQIEGCLLGFIQHYKIYKEAVRQEQFRGNLCHSYGETLQCLHMAFIKCPPNNLHLNFMEVKLPNPIKMQSLCFSDNTEKQGSKDEVVSEGERQPTQTVSNASHKSTTLSHFNDNRRGNELVYKSSESIKTRLHSGSTYSVSTTTEPVYNIGNSVKIHLHIPNNKEIEQLSKNSEDKNIPMDVNTKPTGSKSTILFNDQNQSDTSSSKTDFGNLPSSELDNKQTDNLATSGFSTETLTNQDTSNVDCDSKDEMRRGSLCLRQLSYSMSPHYVGDFRVILLSVLLACLMFL